MSVFTAKNDFEHIRGPRNSADAVNLTYDRHTLIYHTKILISVGLASLAQLCVRTKY